MFLRSFKNTSNTVQKPARNAFFPANRVKNTFKLQLLENNHTALCFYCVIWIPQAKSFQLSGNKMGLSSFLDRQEQF